METLGDVLARERRTDDVAIRDDGRSDDEFRGDSKPGETPTVEYTYHDFVTTAWKTANFFSHRGIHEGSSVAVVDDPAISPVLAFFGAAQLGAVTRFGPPQSVDADLLLGPGDAVLGYDLPPGVTRLAYTSGENVSDPTVESFGRSVWSENPVEPPEDVAPGAPALWTPDGALPHSDLLARAEAVAADLVPEADVVVRASLSAVGTVVAGVLAPLLAGATVVFPDEATTGDTAVVDGDGQVPEERVIVIGD